MKVLKGSLNKVYTWDEYFKFHQELVDKNKTTGSNQSEEMIHYTSLNLHRSKRLRKHFSVSDSFKNIILELKPQNWILISEPWCGDAAQSLPIIAAIAELNAAIDLKIVLRDEHLELMDMFLTHGGRSIPKLIITDSETNNVVGGWGPRPESLQKLFLSMRNGKTSFDELKRFVQNWYNKDKGESILLEVVSIASKA